MHSHSVAIHKSLNAPSVGRQRFCLSLKCWPTGINRDVSAFEALQDKQMASWEKRAPPALMFNLALLGCTQVWEGGGGGV